MAKLIAPKISQENPLLRALKLGQITLRDQQYEVKGITTKNPQGLLVKLKDSTERPFRISKTDVIEALRIMDAKDAENNAKISAREAHKETVRARLFRAASLVSRHHMPPSRINAAPASARSQAAHYHS